ncbi:unnamed protein product, partial [Rotaria sp. Silwood1]
FNQDKLKRKVIEKTHGEYWSSIIQILIDLSNLIE